MGPERRTSNLTTLGKIELIVALALIVATLIQRLHTGEWDSERTAMVALLVALAAHERDVG